MYFSVSLHKALFGRRPEASRRLARQLCEKLLALHIDCSLAAFVHRSLIWDVLRSSQISINACVKVGVKSVTGRHKTQADWKRPQ